MTVIDLDVTRQGLTLSVEWTADTPVRLTMRLPGQHGRSSSAQPLVEAITAGDGRNWAGPRLVTTLIGQRLRYRSHDLLRRGAWQTLSVVQFDEASRLAFTSVLSVHDDQAGVRGYTTVRNEGSSPVTVHAVTSLVIADFGWRDPASLDSFTLTRGRSDWLAEGRWATTSLRSAGLPQLTYPQRPFRSRGCIEVCSTGSWSTVSELPVGVLRDDEAGVQWSFQIEHNGPWVWQVGELADGLYLALSGPTDEHHQWSTTLEAGQTFESVPVSVALERSGAAFSLAALTRFRRASDDVATRRPGVIVFNDYMNTVNGDPSTKVLLPLIDAAARQGADVFVIDAGWYAENGDWWDSVGEWQPSTRRFPGGFDEVLGRIHNRGMVSGLWLEPEVIGVNSPMAIKLPDEAFLLRHGRRVAEHGRYHLDFTAPASIAFLDEVVDRLVNDHGVGYFKFDYNIRSGPGADVHATSAGHGLLLHNRAYLAWIESLRARHPRLILENCASGGMRADFATTSRFDLQSTSDQEDLHAYAPIAASAPMLLVPEQAANWAYPQPDMTDRDITFTLVTGMAGPLYLSGWLDRLTETQADLVRQAVTAHRGLADKIGQSTPVWPLGLPDWQDDWVALGFREDGEGGALHLLLWRRSDTPGEVAMPLPPAPAGLRWSDPTPVFPEVSELHLALGSSAEGLVATDAIGVHAARVVTLHPVAD